MRVAVLAADGGHCASIAGAEPEQESKFAGHALAPLGSRWRETTARCDQDEGVPGVVRTSTTEVDRRRTPREQVDLPCRLNVGGGSHAARVIDLSLGGAAVRGGPELQPGGRGTLALDGVGLTLPFEVRAMVDGVPRLAFGMDAATAAAFQTWFEGPRRRHAA